MRWKKGSSADCRAGPAPSPSLAGPEQCLAACLDG